jgi:hypothetical protein
MDVGRMRDVVKAEVPSWRWGERFDPRIVRTLSDAADAANELSLALIEARTVADRWETAYERLSRDGSLTEPRRVAGADGLYRAASDFTEQVARVYAREALYFAWLSGSLLGQLHNGVAPDDLHIPDSAVLRPSQLYADDSLLPPPPASFIDPPDTPAEESASKVYARVLYCLRIGRLDESKPRYVMDVGFDPATFPDEAEESIWGSGGVDLAEALHQYGHVCLWNLAHPEPGGIGN